MMNKVSFKRINLICTGLEHDSSYSGKRTGSVAHLPQYGRGQHNVLIPMLMFMLVLVLMLVAYSHACADAGGHPV